MNALLGAEGRSAKKGKLKNEQLWMWVAICGPIMEGQMHLSDAW